MKLLYKYLVFLMVFFFSTLGSSSVFAAAPTFTVAFSPTTLGPSSTSTMTYTIDNSAETTGVSGLTFSNTLPTGISINNPNNSSSTCVDGTYSATSGSDSITFSDYRLGLGTTCTFQLDVTSSTPGTYTNTTGALSTSAGTVSAASADLTIDASRPGFSSAFSPSTVVPNAVSTLTYTIDNTLNGSAANSLLFSNTLPAGMTIALIPNASSTCTGGVLTATSGTNTFNIYSANVTANNTCSVSFDVTTSVGGTYLNKSGELSQNGSNSSGFTTAILSVESPFMYANFPVTASPGSSVTLSYTLNNLDRRNTASDITFTNDLNATLSGLAATSLPADGFCGAGSTLTGTSTLTIAGANLAPEGSCTFDVTVLIPSNAATSSYTNTTSTINLTLGSPTTKPAISNDLVIKKAPTLTATFIDDPVNTGDDVTLRYVLTNTDSANAVSDISFTENYNDVLPGMVAKILPSADACGTGSTFTASSNDGTLFFFQVSGANLVADGSCTFDLILTTPSDITPNEYAFTTSNVSATISAETVYSPAATDELVVISAPSLTLDIVEGSISPGSTVTANFTLDYSANATADSSSIGFTVDLEAALSGMTSTTTSQSDICGSGSSFSGTSVLTLSDATLPLGTNCTFSVTLQIPADAAPSTISTTSSIITADTNSTAVSHAAASDTFIVSGLSLSKSFVTNPALAGGNSILRYTITNSASALAATSIIFTDSLTSVISSMSATALPSTPCNGSSTITGITSLTFSAGELQSGESCSFDVPISIPAGASTGTYNSATSQMNATVGGSNTVSSAANDSLTIESLTVLLSTTASNSTEISPIPVTINFSRPVVNFVASDLVIINGSTSNFTGSGDTYTVDIIPAIDGTVSIDLPANAVDDAVDNTVQNPAATQLSLTYTATVVTLTPSAVISEPSITKTNTGPITYTVTYSNAETVNLTTASISLNAVGTTATINVTNGATSTPTVTLSNISGDGSLGFSINAESARNGIKSAPAVGPSSVVEIDNTKPTVIISDVVSDPFNTPFTATATFSEAVTGFSIADITPSNATLSSFSATSASVYTVLVTPISDGAVSLNVAANVAVDSTGNGNTIASALTTTYDSALPTLILSGAGSLSNAVFTATATFNENVTGFSVADITPSNATLSNFSATSASTYTVLVTPISDGTVSLNVAANVATDSAGNGNMIASALTTTYDSVLPTITLSGAAPQSNSAFTATATFSEAVTGFSIADIIPSNATLSNFSATSASVYTVLVTPSSDGAVSLNVAANVATDSAGNGNVIATQFNIIINAIISLKSSLSIVPEVVGGETIITVVSTITAGADITINLAYSGSAINGSDYSGIPSITIPSGQTTASAPLSIIVNNEVEDKENIIIDISSITGGSSNSAIEKDQQQEVIFITDDDSALLTLTSSATNIIEENGSSILTVTLDKVTFEPVTIMLSYSGTATSGVDFIALPASITIPSGETSGEISLNTINDSAEELDETIITDITGVSGGKTNENSIQQQVITIVNDDNETTTDSAIINEDNTIQIDVLSNDISINGALNPASVIIQSQAQHGLTRINTSNGVITYEPNADFNGSDQFSYTVTNLNDVISEPTIVTITINNINDAPIAVNDTASVTEDNIVLINVLANDSDIDNAIEINTDSFVISKQASHGQATIVNDQIKYEPITGFSGSDIFSYSIKDISGAISNIATVSVNISGANDTPITVADIGNTNEDSPVILSVLTNDSDIDGQIDITSLEIIMLPSHGNVQIESDGTLLYTPKLNFFGSDTFTYTVKDLQGAVSKDTLVTVSVQASNDAPIAHDDIAILQGSSFDINVTGNDTDIDSELNTASLSIVIQPTNGSVALNGNMLRYSPTGNFNNNDSFSYTIEDAAGKLSNIATVDITVLAVNDLPVANNDAVSVLEDHIIAIDLLANDQDIDGTLNTESITLHNLPERGTIEINSNTGEATYIPVNNFYGNDSFTYTVKDNENGISNTATVMIVINPVNDVPVISGTPQLGILVDESYNFIPFLLDAENDTLEISVSNLPTWLSVNTVTGELTGLPTFNNIGIYQNIFIQVSDGKSTVGLAEFSIEVLGDNDADGIPDIDDDDDDNDGMTDNFEIANNFNPFDSSDAAEDTDNDGLNNLNEQLQGSNPHLDDQAPIFELPIVITINASALFTTVSDVAPPVAVDGLDGSVPVSLEGELSRTLMPGRHYLTWFSIDAAGNRSEVKQQIDIYPLVSLSKNQLVGEGSTGKIQVLLNGIAPEYPLSVSFSVTGSADSDDHDLSASTIIFKEGEVKKNITFHVANDDIKEGEEQISVNLIGSGNFSNQNQHTTTIIEENAAPLVLLTASQNDVNTLIIDKNSGLVDFNVVVNDPNTGDAHIAKWQFSKNILPVSEFDLNSKIDPSNLVAGIYTATVSISDNGTPLASTIASLTFRVVDGFSSLLEKDSDGDGVSDKVEGWGDDDQDGQPNYLDTVAIPNVINLAVEDGLNFLIEADPGLKMVLGERALFNGKGAKLVLGKLPKELILPTDSFFKTTEYIDFIVNDLQMLGQSVNIVLPQRQPIPENAIYRKFNTTWYTFIENSKNWLMSAPGNEGRCPPPESTLFRDGLNSGDWCVQMTIEDGGPNDADGLANGSIKDPGGVTNLNTDTDADTDNLGGGSMGLSLLLLIGLLIYRVAYNSKGNFKYKYPNKG